MRVVRGSPLDLSGLAFDSAAVAFAASGQSIIGAKGATNSATVATSWPGVSIAGLAKWLVTGLSDGFAVGVLLEPAWLFATDCVFRLAQQPCACIDAQASAATTTLAVFAVVAALVPGVTSPSCAAALIIFSQPRGSRRRPSKSNGKRECHRTILSEERNRIWAKFSYPTGVVESALAAAAGLKTIKRKCHFL